MKLHSLMRVFDGMPVKITAKRSHDMTTAIRIAEEFELNYILEDCTESWLIPDILKKHQVNCVVGPSYGQKVMKAATVTLSLVLYLRNTALPLPHPPLIRE